MAAAYVGHRIIGDTDFSRYSLHTNSLWSLKRMSLESVPTSARQSTDF
ncbi:MAG: hypothetical protein ACI90G_000521 [Urechidicola sp.]|jgi:hypothetical protein